MGGSAFTAQPHGLATPRMPPALYIATVADCHRRLQKLFKIVQTPIEAPEKQDHGDVDVLVADPIDQQDQSFDTSTVGSSEKLSAVWAMVVEALGAEKFIRKPKENSSHFAIPYDRDSAPLSSSGQQQHAGDNELGTRSEPPWPPLRYIQVDVRICDSERELRWAAFKHAHGDLWSILGSILRPWGLTADEKALWLRVPEIEAVDKKRARVFLTDDPDQVLDFLRLDRARWAAPFASYDELFRYAASTWLFFLAPVAPVTTDHGMPPAGGFDGGDDAEAQPTEKKAGVGTDDQWTPGYYYKGQLEDLKANDRRRMKMRPLFRAWIDRFVPESRAAGLYPAQPPFDLDTPHAEQRWLLKSIVFERFPGTRELCDSRLAEFRREAEGRRVWNEVIKRGVDKAEVLRLASASERFGGWQASEHELHAMVCAALKKIVFEGDESFGGIVPDAPVRDPEGDWRIEEARRFVEGRWRDVAPLAWEKQLEKMAARALKRKAESDEAEADDAKRKTADSSISDDMAVAPAAAVPDVTRES